MKKILLLLTILTTSIHFLVAQRNPLKGSGKKVNKIFAFTNFDKVELLDLDGKIDIAAGKPFAVAVTIDDNLESLLDVTVSDGTLHIKLKGNYSNRLYIEETNIHIKISLPQILSVFHRSNGILTVNGIDGKYFKIKNTGNGSTFLNGSIDELELVCRDNGSVHADKLLAKIIHASRSGNGNIYINDLSKVTQQSSGNGEVIVVNKKDNPANKTPSNTPRLLSSIQNLSSGTVYLSVKYPVKGAYGIDIKPQETIQEYFPIGTKIYKGNQFTIFKTPMIVITEKNKQDTFIVR
jgi:Putative auto-transporter adhesin, head GIN domain